MKVFSKVGFPQKFFLAILGMLLLGGAFSFSMVHCNWGWNGVQNGYFIFGAFERMFQQQQGRYWVGDRPYNNNNYYYRSIYPDTP